MEIGWRMDGHGLFLFLFSKPLESGWKHLETRYMLTHIANQLQHTHTHTHLAEWEILGVETVILFSNQVICDKLIQSPCWNTFPWLKPSQTPTLNLAAVSCWLIFLLCQNKGSVHRHVSALKHLCHGLSYLFFKRATPSPALTVSGL